MHDTEHRLLAVFAALLAGCTSTSEDPRTSLPETTSTNECYESLPRTVAVYGAAAAGIRSNTDRVEACMMACSVHAKDETGPFGGRLIVDSDGTCEIQREVPPGLETDDGDDDDDGGELPATTSSSSSSGDVGSTSTGGPDGSGSGGTTGSKDDWGYEVNCPYQAPCFNVGGRGHAGVRSEPAVADGDPTARWLAAAAHEEAASVDAFEALCEELARVGAPQQFIMRAMEAAEDERRHAATMAGLAHARGVAPNPVRFSPPSSRSLEDLALENAVEGCVRETWAALEAAHQSKHAPDAELRAVMSEIAADEARHAALALDLDRWFRTQLDAAAQRRLDLATGRALERLAADQSSRADVGLPSAARARRLQDGLFRELAAVA